MKKVLLIHGFTGDGNGVWFPWIKRELETRGYEVFAPSLPDSTKPDLDAWLSAIAPFMDKLGSDDIIVAHSLGAKLALHAVLKHRKKIGRVILVAPAIGNRSEEEWQRRGREWPGPEIPIFRKFWEAYLPREDVAQFAKITAIFSEDDPLVPVCPKDVLPKEWDYKVWNGFGHFLALSVPKLLDEIVK